MVLQITAYLDYRLLLKILFPVHRKGSIHTEYQRLRNDVFTLPDADSETDSYTDSIKIQKSFTGIDTEGEARQSHNDNGLIPSYQYQNRVQYPLVSVSV